MMLIKIIDSLVTRGIHDDNCRREGKKRDTLCVFIDRVSGIICVTVVESTQFYACNFTLAILCLQNVNTVHDTLRMREKKAEVNTKELRQEISGKITRIT